MRRYGLVIAGVAALSICAVDAAATDVSGTWTARVVSVGRYGVLVTEHTFQLKADRGKLTGTVSTSRRRGELSISDHSVGEDKTPATLATESATPSARREWPISEGTITGDKISFVTTFTSSGTLSSGKAALYGDL